MIKLEQFPICEACHESPAVEVHHVEPVKRRPDRALELANLQALCRSCHKLAESRLNASPRPLPPPFSQGGKPEDRSPSQKRASAVGAGGESP